ncbi:MAG: UvrD-helicase domain-containing protein, partial [Desulfobacterales bacterium]|nr:UvrD-helicase domain-containing protein [Desulfobacterales bacterium]
MRFTADLHIHSKYSRATARNLDLENLYQAAQIKGLTLIGTGDFTHPAWMEELETKLEETEPGLFSLKKEIAETLDPLVPESCRNEVRFILQAEISNIYKKDGRVRKNHNLIYMPDIDTAKRFNARLDAIGNIKSDGRPILGLDARNLLEIMLETSDQGFLVPAHIWTPWFSMFGSKSGFDTIEECFDDLASHIFACETGLSSDPPMNWRVKNLDNITLISNSDAHSPGFLGRNASVFDTQLDYWAVRRALETCDLSAYRGTLDMYPDQGKYHYDGHRKCNIRLNPDDTAGINGICPECGRPLTLGVLYRVRELADRPEGYMPENRHPHSYLVPLADILSEIFEVGPKTKKVTGYYNKAIENLGPELGILTHRSFDEIDAAGVPLLAEAVKKMRAGDLHIDPGYDGEFGKVNIFTREEKETIRGEKNLLFDLPKKKKRKTKAEKEKAGKPASVPRVKLRKKEKKSPAKPQGLLDGLNPDQDRAVRSSSRAVLIQAGPGTGKTRTLTARIAWLISDRGIAPNNILALTFTNKAAKELSQRIEAFRPGDQAQAGGKVVAATFHGFCLSLLKECTGFSRGLMEDELRMELLEKACLDAEGKSLPKRRLKQIDGLISTCKQQLLGPDDDLSPATGDEAGQVAGIYRAYNRICMEQNLADFEDLIFLCFKDLSENGALRAKIRERFTHIFVDEYQDLNLGQYRLVKLLAKNSHILVIGDPDQSIYGFRGSDNRFFKKFTLDYPGCEQIRLRQNYRSTQTILDASFQMISTRDRDPDADETRKIFSSLETSQKVVIKETASESAEAVAAGKMIEELVGGLSFLSVDAGKAGGADGIADTGKEYSFADFAVLYRTRRQCQAFARAFEAAGIPFQTADREDWFTMPGVREALSLLRIILARGSAADETVLTEWQGENREKALAGDFKSGLLSIREMAGGLTSEVFLEKAAGMLGTGGDPDKAGKPGDDLSAAWERLVSLARIFPNPGDLLDGLRLNQDQDLLEKGVEKVSLMTMHAAKGLEFPVVFVTGCEEGMIPYARDGETVDDPDEERRLFYVAMT